MNLHQIHVQVTIDLLFLQVLQIFAVIWCYLKLFSFWMSCCGHLEGPHVSPWPSLPATPWPHCEVTGACQGIVLRLTALRQRSTPYTLVADNKKHVCKVAKEHGSTEFNHDSMHCGALCSLGVSSTWQQGQGSQIVEQLESNWPAQNQARQVLKGRVWEPKSSWQRPMDTRNEHHGIGRVHEKWPLAFLPHERMHLRSL